VDDVSTVLGLVGRDLLIDLIEAVIAEDGPRAFALADRAVESGTDLRLVCRELSRVVRDMMVLSVDPARAGDGELADDERERLTALARDFSREDLMRAFDLLSQAEQDIRNASHPRYHFEMVLLRWMHLRKLVPLVDLLEQLGGGARTITPPRNTVAPASRAVAAAKNTVAPTRNTVVPTSGGVTPTRNAIASTSSAAAPARNIVAPESTVAPTKKTIATDKQRGRIDKWRNGADQPRTERRPPG